MSAPSCHFSFAQLDKYMTGNGSATLSHGARPSVFTVEVAEVYELVQQVGTFAICMNGQAMISFPNCAIDGIYKGSGGEGEVRYTVRILDRRWMWWKGGGHISGSYNIRKPDKTIIAETKKTPQELAKLCLDKLKETGYDVSQLPDKIDEDRAPEIVWDYTPPAEALEDLVSKLGCRIVYTTDDRIRICQIGEGQSLPYGAIKTEQDSVESATVPDSLMFIAGPTIWQGLLKVEAVGTDIDSKIQKIDDLKYKPTDGWEAWTPEHCSRGVDYGDDDDERAKARRYAQQTVWRTYRLVGQPDGKLGPVPEFEGDIDNTWQYVLRDELLDTGVTDDGSVSHLKAIVFGQFADPDLAAENDKTVPSGNTPRNTLYPGDISIDSENGLVRFSSPVYRFDVDGNYVEPELYVYCTYYLKDAKSRIPDRYTQEFQMPVNPTGTGPMPFVIDDVHKTVMVKHTFDSKRGYQVASPKINTSEVKSAAEYYANAKQKELVPDTGSDKEYDLFVNISPDGALQQITWQWAEGQGSTRASRNTEHSVLVPRYQQRQAMAQALTIKQKLEEIKRQMQ